MITTATLGSAVLVSGLRKSFGGCPGGDAL